MAYVMVDVEADGPIPGDYSMVCLGAIVVEPVLDTCFISDNNGFDWQFVNWYFHHFVAANPFGHSSTNLGSLYKGLVRDMVASFKHLRKTRHSHHPVDDARGNAEALLRIKDEFGLKISCT
jgi:hypothetical protein